MELGNEEEGDEEEETEENKEEEEGEEEEGGKASAVQDEPVRPPYHPNPPIILSALYTMPGTERPYAASCAMYGIALCYAMLCYVRY